MSDPRFKVGNKVVVRRAFYGFADQTGVDDVEVPVGAKGKVIGVRPVTDPHNVTFQGPWLYDIEFKVRVTLPDYFEREKGEPEEWAPGAEVNDLVWAIYDRRDIDEVEPAPAGGPQS